MEAVKAGQAGGDSDGDGAADAWTMIDSLADWQSLAEGPTPKRLFGLAPVATTLQQDRPGDTLVHPFGVELIKNVPSLRHMTRVALNVLDNNPNGFFMMIEGGAVDWASHSNQMGRLIEEQIDFNRAVEAVVAWIDSTSSWSETLLIIPRITRRGTDRTGFRPCD
jgi:alkaline phosphatase